jgi:hypothetical protein
VRSTEQLKTEDGRCNDQSGNGSAVETEIVVLKKRGMNTIKANKCEKEKIFLASIKKKKRKKEEK